jgi:hypothetical protein
MFVEGTWTHPCHSFAVGKPAMVVVRVQGASTPHSFNAAYNYKANAGPDNQGVQVVTKAKITIV